MLPAGWLASLVLIVFTLSTHDATARNVYVGVGASGLNFNPQFLTITTGDTVTFYNLGGLHNVVADDGSFRCAHGCDNDGAGGSGNATSLLWSATVVFTHPGKIGYFCEIHGSPGLGMYGTISVLAPPPSAVSASPVPLGGAIAGIVLAVGLFGAAAFRASANTL